MVALAPPYSELQRVTAPDRQIVNVVAINTAATVAIAKPSLMVNPSRHLAYKRAPVAVGGHPEGRPDALSRAPANLPHDARRNERFADARMRAIKTSVGQRKRRLNRITMTVRQTM